MPESVIYAAAVVAIAFVTFKLFRAGPSLSRVLDRAVSDNSIAPVLEAVERVPEARRSMYFQQAIAGLWEGFHRKLAVELIREFVARHSDEKITQFWLKQAVEVEPLSARKVLDEEFLKQYYRPEIAQCCGKTSG